MSENELTYPGGKLRLHVEAALGAGARVTPDEKQSHYLLHVMRAKSGDRVNLFNGRDGEWSARVADVSKRSCVLACERMLAEQSDVPDLWLCFAPIKRTPADYVVQKATELGVRMLQPVLTHRTIVSRVNLERMRANAVEAAEQSGRMSIPEMRAPLSLDKLLATWPKERRLIFCDESGDAPPMARSLAAEKNRPFAILTGPEGGFDPTEREALRAHAFVIPVGLGPRILRADTAALAGLAIWQSVCGDWH
ncbi:MAG TPA: 16S rRNA (uracil(1498)-N(3))-methyltransferase [Rhizomicrobium sp.]|jgi:16S rRNA (uracil1498-N3)-methyltransferase